MPNFFSHPALTLLRDRDFRNVWIVGGLTSVMRWLEMLAIAVVGYDLSGSPLVVALLSLLRMLPLGLLGAVCGALSDAMSRRLLLILGCIGMTVVSCLQAWLAATGRIEIWHLAIGALCSGIFWTTDFPARRTLMGIIAGPERVAAAMSIDQTFSNITRGLGPALGGGILALSGLHGAFILGVFFYGFSILLMLVVREEPTEVTSPRQGILRNIGDGLRHLLGDRAMQGALAITVAFNIWGFPYTTMIPVIGRDYLNLGPFPVGLMASAEGMGAFAGSLIMILFARPAYFHAYYFFGTGFCMTMVLLFSFITNPWLAGVAVFCAGFGTGFFASMQATIIFLSAPPAMRSRLMGLLMVCIGTAPIGMAHIGWLASVVGAPRAAGIVATEGLLALLAIWIIWPEVRRAAGPAAAQVRDKTP